MHCTNYDTDGLPYDPNWNPTELVETKRIASLRIHVENGANQKLSYT